VANETILVVDADTKSQKVLEVSFKKAGYRVIITDSPLQAMRLMVSEQPDLIISDSKFDDGDGFALLASLKEAESTRSIPFIFLTEDRSLPQKMRGFELGADDYLTKPVYIKEVTTRVELLLQKRAKDMLSDSEIEELEGDLADITMIDLLQTIEEEMRSGSIRLSRNEREAVVYFREGNILDAICGKLQGEEAIYRLMLWPEGRFHLQYHEIANRPDRVPKDSNDLLLVGIQRLGTWNELVDELPSFQNVFEADYTQLPNLDQLPGAVARIARLYDGVRSIRDVLDDSPVDDVTTLQITQKLLADGALKNVAAHNDRAPERSNLATWLETRDEDRGRKDTAPKFGAQSRGAEARPDVEPMVPQILGPDASASDKPSWSFHFEGDSNPKEAIRKIEEEEKKRQEAEAIVLTGQHRAITQHTATQHMIAAVNRNSSTETAPLSKLVADIRAADEIPSEGPADPIRTTDLGVSSLSDVRPERVTERLVEAVSRTTDPNVKPVSIESPDDEPVPSMSRHRRKRQPTPISTPAQTTRLQDQTFDDDEDDVPEIEEVSTKELPNIASIAEAHDDIVAARAVAEAESLLDTAANLADARADEQTDESWPRLSDELSEGDAFEDDEAIITLDFPENAPIDEIQTSREFSVTERERVTQDLRPLAEQLAKAKSDQLDDAATSPEAVDALGEFDPANDVTPFPGELPAKDDGAEYELEEIEDVEVVPPLVERTAKDGELVVARFDLSRSGSRVPAALGAVAPELETVELPDREKAGSEKVDTLDEPVISLEEEPEESFFSATDRSADRSADEFHVDEPPNRAGVIVIGIIAALVIGLMIVISQNGQETPIDAPVAVIPTPDPIIEEPVIEEPVVEEPVVEPLDAIASAFGKDVEGRATESALLFSGVIPGFDASAIAEPDAGTEEVAVVEPVEEPINNVPKEDPIKQNEPVEAAPTGIAGRISAAEKLVKRENFGPALEALRALSADESSNGKIAFLHGQAAFGSMRNSEAIEQYTRAEKLGHRPANLYLDLGAAYQLEGNKDKAKSAYEKFLQLRPTGRDSDEVRSILKNRF
jgi:DNA-binding response OmpR family regulator